MSLKSAQLRITVTVRHDDSDSWYGEAAYRDRLAEARKDQEGLVDLLAEFCESVDSIEVVPEETEETR